MKRAVIGHTARHASNRVVSSELTKVMKPETPRRLSLESIFTPELRDLEKVFRRHGYELRIAGGAVRDLLSEKVPSDLDFATTATPDQMKNMFEAENIRMINKRGEQHGTVTCRINDKVALDRFLLKQIPARYGFCCKIFASVIVISSTISSARHFCFFVQIIWLNITTTLHQNLKPFAPLFGLCFYYLGQ